MLTLTAWSPAVIGYFGPMYSGKTMMGFSITYAIERAIEQGSPIEAVVIRPQLDNRDDDPSFLTNHLGVSRQGFEACLVDEKRPWTIVQSKKVQAANVVIIDEAQFFRPRIGQVVQALHEQGKRVYLLGLDLDFLGRPFPAFRAIKMALGQLPASQVELNLMTAICDHCGGQATHSIRLIGSQIASPDSGMYAIEGSQQEGKKVTYKPACMDFLRGELAAAGIEAPWLDEK